ncbi:pimeloyl-ACP methyl ester carboxylesterase [Rhodanobacter sp. ANJX3]|uniref:XVIPCD domain-containing protein n=1 Tax=Rhodanobacter sp. ANJX3 TaxID=2723083 RepID=UPI00160AA2FF|nr:XVIPCD domain-containing protein [Rhodanobacter sp. ANJX3]MBB5357659.1 pimeloyl-ACP methyl ester carboxylesterase [Rhodanobacter sp. ANJX3]
MTLSTEDHAMLAADAYNTHSLGQEVTLAGIRYKVLDEAHDRLTGYQGTAYVREDTGDVVIAHCGTDAARMKYQDIATDIGMVTAGVNVQTADAMAFTKKALEQGKNYDEQNHLPFHATVTGHSLGGTLAEITAYKYNLHGETFNAYGAAGLFQGVPEGGHQVINYVRATDVVSAASQHFGETRIYASPQDIDRLQKAGYHDTNGPLSPRLPIEGVDLDAHSVTNFLPDNPRLGHSIISKENEALYASHKGMIDQYRHDVLAARTVVSLPWEEQKAGVELGAATARFVGEKATEGLRTTERAAQYVEHEAAKGYHATVDAASRGIDATVHAADEVAKEVSRGTHAIGAAAGEAYSQRHPAGWSSPLLNDPAHPDHGLFQQAYDGVKKIDAEHGRASDHRSVNLAGVLAVEGKAAGLKQIDVVALSHNGSNAFAAQKEARLGFPNVVHVNTTQAVNTPIEHSTQQMAQVNQQQAQVHAQVQAQMQVQNQAAQAAPGPQMGGPGR